MKELTKPLRLSPKLGAAIAAGLIILGGFMWLCIWAVFGDTIPRIGFINAFGWPIAIAAFVAGLTLLLLRRWIVGALGLVLALVISFQGFGLSPGAMFASDKASNSVRIVSASLRTHNKDMESAAREIASHSPNIIALQEVSDLTAFKAELEQQTNAKWNVSSDRHFATLAKTPVRGGGANQRNWVSTEVEVDGQWISIWNLHAPKNFARPGSNSVYFVELVDAISEKKPDIVLGDFNSTPWNFGYSAVAGVMENAHRNAGFGPGTTFPARGRRLGMLGATSRIDHIFFDSEHKATYAGKGKASPGSDHHPIIADIEF